MAAEKVNAAIVGCGSFGTNMHLPNMRKDGRYNIIAACDLIEEKARLVKENYGSEYATTDADKVFNDPNVDLVIVTTRHDKHAELSVRAARAGKNILCEKPMGMTPEECRAVFDAVRENGVKYCIGYNRGLAPMIERSRRILAPMNRPFLVYHRMQVNMDGGASWLLHDAEGGGRMVGEGCHIFDLFCALADSEPVRVHAEGGILTGNADITKPDSALITMGFENGVAATACISSVGANGLSKEWTEIYCGPMAITIDLFQTMTVYRPEGTETLEASEVDKGHQREVGLLADALLHDAPLPNNESNALRAALVAHKVHDAIATGELQTLSKDQYGL